MIWQEDEKLKSLEPYVILCGYRGSIAHGTYEENTTHDDKDILGVFVNPPNSLFGIREEETVERMIEERVSEKKTVVWDVVYYSLRHFLRMLMKQNPNVLCLLWLDEKYYIKTTLLGRDLISYRKNLLSKQCYYSFSGYAHGQLHRMTHPAPTGQLGAKRKELVQRFGYDVKNASHLIRLLRMGVEVMVTGELQVERPDNNLLLEIKRGEWSLEKVITEADRLFKLMDEALVRSTIQNKVDEDYVNKLCEDITKSFYSVPPSGEGGLESPYL